MFFDCGSPVPVSLLEEEASPAILRRREFWKRSGGFKRLELIISEGEKPPKIREKKVPRKTFGPFFLILLKRQRK